MRLALDRHAAAGLSPPPTVAASPRALAGVSFERGPRRNGWMKRYRAFEIGDDGGISGEAIVILATNDFEAMVRAMEFASTRGLEVWDEHQRVGVIERRDD